jgi:hypothetical protein
MDIKNLDVIKMIKTNEYVNNISTIKNYEDTIHKLFISGNKSTLLSDDLICLHKIDDSDLFPHIKQFDFNMFEVDNYDLLKNVVIMGPYVRSLLINQSNELSKNIKRRNEIYMYLYSDIEWSSIMDISDFDNNKNEYVFETESYKIYLVKKKFKSPSHIILQRDYLKRICWLNGNIYTSSMFLIEFQKHVKYIESNYKDPYLNIPYDPLEIYELIDSNKSHPFYMIDYVNYEEFLKIPHKYLTKLYNSKTCLEYCFEKYIAEEHPLLQYYLKQIIIYLCEFTYLRPPYLYAKILGFDKSNIELYTTIKSVNNTRTVETTIETIIEPNTIDDINLLMLLNFIKNDNLKQFIEYIEYVKFTVTKIFIKYIVEYKAITIASYIASNKLFDENMIYYLILMTEHLELIEVSGIKFNIDIAINYIKDIIENTKIRSFYYLYELDPSILLLSFDNNNNILHLINDIADYDSFIELIMKLKPELIDKKNDDKLTPVSYHTKNKSKILISLLKYNFDITQTDNNGNTFFHYLCMTNDTDTLKIVLKKYSELINIPNNNYETPVIMCCKYNNENMYYILKSMGADLDEKDCYGNTVYHYICLNKICIGTIIKNEKNKFGLSPLDYLKLSHVYYSVIE